MPSSSKPSATAVSLPIATDTSKLKADLMCSICVWLERLHDGTLKEILRHKSKFHPPA